MEQTTDTMTAIEAEVELDFMLVGELNVWLKTYIPHTEYISVMNTGMLYGAGVRMVRVCNVGELYYVYSFIAAKQGRNAWSIECA